MSKPVKMTHPKNRGDAVLVPPCNIPNMQAKGWQIVEPPAPIKKEVKTDG